MDWGKHDSATCNKGLEPSLDLEEGTGCCGGLRTRSLNPTLERWLIDRHVGNVHSCMLTVVGDFHFCMLSALTPRLAGWLAGWLAGLSAMRKYIHICATADM